MTKKCNRCLQEKELSCFSKNKAKVDGLSQFCRDCGKKYNKDNAEKIQAKHEKYRESHRDELRGYQREYMQSYRAANPGLYLMKQRERRRENIVEVKKKRMKFYHENRDRILNKSKQWRELNDRHYKRKTREWKDKNLSQIRQKYIERYRNDPQFCISVRLRSRMRQALKSQMTYKSNRWMGLIGCNLSQLVQHLESKFTEGMSWSNRGKWHIDHIKPCISFDLTDPQQQKLCFHYSNLQPLWGIENLSKGSK